MAKFRVTYKDAEGIILSEIIPIENRSNIPYIVEVRTLAKAIAKEHDLKIVSIEDLL